MSRLFVMLFAALSVTACASVETRRGDFRRNLDATVGKNVSDTFLRNSADSIAASDEGERRFYSLKGKDCKWSVLTRSGTETVDSWRYESPPESCYSGWYGY